MFAAEAVVMAVHMFYVSGGMQSPQLKMAGRNHSQIRVLPMHLLHPAFGYFGHQAAAAFFFLEICGSSAPLAIREAFLVVGNRHSRAK